jgi:hypothetical protein
MRRLVTLVAALCLLALPSAALAQNAGDEQYSDPFGQSGEENGGTDNGGTQESPPADPAQSDGTIGESEPEISEGSSGATLPRTGLPVLLVAGSGALLLVGGTTLRRRTS